MSLDSTLIINHIQFVNDEIGWILPFSGNSLQKTTNRGQTWENLLIDPNAIINSFYFVNQNIGWAVGNYRNERNLYKTIDGGQTWDIQNCPRVCELNSIRFLNENEGWAVGFNSVIRESYIFKTVDGGTNWTLQQIPTKDILLSIDFATDNCAWLIGDNSIYKKLQCISKINQKSIHYKSLNPQLLKLHQNYPNPFNNSTTINYSIYKSGKIFLQIFDILSQEVATLSNDWHCPGNYTAQWKAENMPSGLYFCQLKTGNYVTVKKIILAK